MGKVTWVIIGAGAGILFGKFLFSLPQSQVLVAKIQDKLDPIEVPGFDEDLGDVAVYDPIEIAAPKPRVMTAPAPATRPSTAVVPTATPTRTTSSPTTTTTTRTRLALR